MFIMMARSTWQVMALRSECMQQVNMQLVEVEGSEF